MSNVAKPLKFDPGSYGNSETCASTYDHLNGTFAERGDDVVGMTSTKPGLHFSYEDQTCQ